MAPARQVSPDLFERIVQQRLAPGPGPEPDQAQTQPRQRS